MKKLIPFLVLLFTSVGFAFGQMDQIYMQRIANGTDNGYPVPMLPGQEWRTYAQPIYEANNLTSWSGDGSFTTFTHTGTNALQPGDGIQIHNYSGIADQICQVSSVPDSTHFVLRNFNCGNTGAPYLAAGSGSATGAYYWKREGTGMSPLGTWSITDHGTTAGKYMLRNADRTASSGGGGCTPDLHTASCYTSAPTLTNAVPWSVYFEADPSVVPVCTMTGSLQTHDLVLTSTVKFTVKFTSNQTPAKNGSTEYILCQDGAGSGVHALPKIQGGYEQVYKNEQIPIMAQVFANADQYIKWSCTPDAGSGGDGFCETFNPPAGDAFVHNSGKLPEAVLHSGTVATGYTIEACADFNPASCTHIRKYVSGQTKPAGNVDKVQLQACDVDPVMTAAGGVVYNIGPGQPFADLRAVPAWAFTWGSEFIIHNESSTVGSPVTLANYVQFSTPTNYASFATNDTVPSFYLCSIPNPTSGELAVITGTNAMSTTHISGIFVGNNITVAGSDPANIPNPDNYQPALQYWHHLGIANLKIMNNDPSISFYPPGATSGPEGPWGFGSALRPFSLQNYSFNAIHFSFIPNGILSDCNAEAGWVRNCSLDVMYRGNHFEGYGIPGQPTEHAVYCQDDRCVMMGNLEDGSKSDQATGGFSMRSTRALYVNNRVYGIDGTYFMPNGWGGDSEVQDQGYYFDINRAFGPTPGWDGTSCSDGTSNYPFCNPNGVSGMAFGGLATYAAFAAEHWDSLYMIGNAMHSVLGANGGCRLGIPQTHGDNGLEMQHNLYYFYNLNDCPNAEGNDGDSFFEDVRPDSGQNDFSIQPIDWPMARWGNSINWWNDNFSLPGGGFRTSFGRPTARALFQTNIVHVGQFTPTQTNITLLYGGDGFNASQYGLNQGVAQDQYVGMSPVEARQGGWLSTNFITSSTKPYSITTLVPFIASVATGAASALPYPALLYRPMFNATDANNNMTRRVSLSDIGPADAAGGPTVTSIRVDAPYGTAAGTINLVFANTFQVAAHCFWSDSTESDCTTTAAWSNGGSTHFNVSSGGSGGLVSSLSSAGSGTLNCVFTAITSNNITTNVTLPPPPRVYFGPGTVLGGQSGSGHVYVP